MECLQVKFQNRGTMVSLPRNLVLGPISCRSLRQGEEVQFAPHSSPLGCNIDNVDALNREEHPGMLSYTISTNMAAIMRGCRVLEKTPFLVSCRQSGGFMASSHYRFSV